ncbi:TPA_asm: BspA family leucine-rich repeat surface protein [Listeria monocytogenes]|nr:BspA family leucine-rich repeat surface protein [Listeria monocytogenes]
MDFKLNKRKKTLRQLVVALLLLCTIGLPIQNIVLANEFSATEEVVTEGTESATTAETDTGNSESMENESVPPFEKEAESTETTSSETVLEESKVLTDTSDVKSSEKQESSEYPSSSTQQSEERPSTKAVTTGTFPNGSTSTWTFDDTTGELSISAGTLVNPNQPLSNLIGVSVIKIKSIVFEGQVVASGSLYNLFYRCANLTSLDLSDLDTSQVTNMSYMFSYASGLTSLDLSDLDTSQVTDMSGMIRNASGLTSLDLSDLDTSQVTDMSSMFSNLTLTSLDLSDLDTSQVTDMHDMFSGSQGLTSLDLSNLDTSQVTDMHDMFGGASGLTSLDLSNLDTSQVTDMSDMFSYATGLTSLNMSDLDTSQVTNMKQMFSSARSLTSLDLSDLDTSQVTDMSYMFANTEGLTSLDVSNFDTSQVTKMYGMFYYTFGLTSLDVSNFDTSKVTEMYFMFYNSGLTALDLSSFDTSNVTEMSGIFNGTAQLKELTLGKGNSFSNTALPDIPETADYTGKWQNVDAASGGTVDRPKGSFVGTSIELMTQYDGSTMADTYVWQPVLAPVVVNVKDSTVMQGDTWNASDNFLDATDDAGNPVSFQGITVSGSVDTTQPGVYKVDYSYDGTTSTATIAVLETMPESWINFIVDGTNVRAIPGSLLSNAEWDLTTGLWAGWNPGTIKVPTDKLPSAPVKEGYTFKGWQDTTGTIVDFSTLEIDLNSTTEFNFIAGYEKNTYNVTFNVDGRQEQQTVLFDELISEPTTPTKDGYLFTGWYDSPTGGDKWDFSTDKMPAKNVELYAHFKELMVVTPGVDPVTPSVVKPITPEVDPVIPSVVKPITPGVDPVTPSVVKPIMPGVDPVTPSVNPPTTPGEGPNVVSPTTPGSGGNQPPSNGSGSNTGNTTTPSPTTSQRGKLAKLGENSSLLLQGFGLLLVLSGLILFWKKRKRTHL